MSTWTTPKTNWAVTRDVTGRINGDYINYTDYNRIKNNMAYLYEVARTVLTVPSYSFGADKTVTDYPYADEYNTIEQALEDLATVVANISYGATKTFYDNGRTPDYSELNRIESAQLDLYGLINSIVNGRRKLSFTLTTERRVF